MTSQEIAIQVWKEKFMAEAQQCAVAFVEAHLQRERGDALQKELDDLKSKQPKDEEPGVNPVLRAVPE